LRLMKKSYCGYFAQTVSAYQSAIIEQCKFSKTKTSELLSAMEKKGIVRRHKKGRDKIVNLNEQAKSE